MKLSSTYCGEFVYDANLGVDYILTPVGQMTNNSGTFTPQFNITDHLGNVRSVVNSSGAVLQNTDYYPFGLAFADNNVTTNRYLFNGKELENYTLGTTYLGTLDYGARHYDPRIARWTVPDPMAEKYYGLSGYVYCATNPVMYIDSDGRDVWEINGQGEVVNRIKDKTQDAFYMVSKDADGNYQRTFTTDADGNKNYKSVSFDYGTVTNTKKAGWFSGNATSFSVTREAAGADLFKFFADNTKIEFGLINTKDNGSLVMTNHKEGSVEASKTAQKLSDKGQTVTSILHNHPDNSQPSGFEKGATRGDKFAANILPNVERFVYQPKNNALVMYDNASIIGSMSWGLVVPSSAKRTPVVPIRRYPGVGLPLP